MNCTLDALRKRLLIECENNYYGGVYGHTQRAIAYNAGRMSGGSITEPQVDAILRTGSIYENGRAPECLFSVEDVTNIDRSFIILRNEILHMSEPNVVPLDVVLSQHIEQCRRLKYHCAMLVDLFIRCINAEIFPAVIRYENSGEYIRCIGAYDISGMRALFYTEQNHYIEEISCIMNP